MYVRNTHMASIVPRSTSIGGSGQSAVEEVVGELEHEHSLETERDINEART